MCVFGLEKRTFSAISKTSLGGRGDVTGLGQSPRIYQFFVTPSLSVNTSQNNGDGSKQW